MIDAKIKPDGDRINQGDVIADVELIEQVYEVDRVLEISKIRFPYIVVLTQDCDLHQDSRTSKDGHTREIEDKWLLSVLVAPFFNAEHVYRGIHLEKLGIHSQVINRNKSPGENLRNNQNPRYHYIEFPGNIQIVPSVIDFKNYFSITVEGLLETKKSNYLCTVEALYREDISQRFASFLSRIGLPDQIR